MIIRKDVESSANLLCYSHMAHFVKTHAVKAFLFSESLISRGLVGYVPHFETSLLILVTLVPRLQALLILRDVTDWIVQHSLTTGRRYKAYRKLTFVRSAEVF